MSIARKLIILALCAASALILVGAAGLYAAREGSTTLEDINNRAIPGLNLLHNVRSEQQQIAIGLFRHTLSTEPAVKAQIEQDMEKRAERVKQDMAGYEALIQTAEGKERFRVTSGLVKEYLGLLAEFITKARASGSAPEMSGPMGAKRAQFSKLLDEHIEFNIESASREAQAAEAAASSDMQISLAIILVALAVIGGLSFSVIRSIKRSLDDIQQAMQKIEGNLDLSVRAQVNGQDEIATVSNALNRLLTKLNASFSSIAGHADKISTSSSQMSDTAGQVAHAAALQSDSASGMAAGIEEMTVSINHVSDRSTEARDLAQESGKLAHDGIRVIDETVSDINAISRSVSHVSSRIRELEAHGDQISSIVSVIKEVADQTNLLALNAAIEAARAGEQGRGFAVVADEVRKLAERTASSTTEISSMVSAIRSLSQEAATSMEEAVSMVEAGVERAGIASQAIHRISEGSNNSQSMVEEISSAIREQSAASNSIAVHVEKIAQMAEESSAAARSSASLANELDQFAQEMQGVVSAYKL
ncbi:methyl-accepting chemotaxis protein [Uliginosibacterium aquaticum]|uniref:Methyl-accepting chemotaxis protein n=1 Tax=Uliginosibacterium aquaticum TaxID=2731212 RepID=A0ABX2IAS5_9RHOO|nr:methyl-accepting chemotaxis protein [Uliginosibacterium aquaticum]NSL53414.1 methyl-accepting chemotaxis protein [Uliginosibacterium aquaticum]